VLSDLEAGASPLSVFVAATGSGVVSSGSIDGSNFDDSRMAAINLDFWSPS
jgi:hypothetical protein